MKTRGFSTTPKHKTYDVVIVGGAIMGSATAWFLTQQPDFNGRVLVVEKDPSYESCSTAHSNSCIRQQFSTELNVKISQFAAEYIKALRQNLGGDTRVPNLTIHEFGYLYLAETKAVAEVLRTNHRVQTAAGADTELLTPDEIAARYPFYQLDDILLGSLNTRDEGYWDGGAVFDWWRRMARDQGVEFVAGEVIQMARNAKGTNVDNLTLANGTKVSCGHVVNAAGPRAAQVAAMAGIALPVEPRKRFTWVIKAKTPLCRDLPLTIDPTGVHMRQDGPETYMIGAKPDPDPGVDPDDFTMDHGIWETHVWPIIATRIPQFESVRIVTEWVGHYAYNLIDQNAITGPHPEVGNFVFLNGFSGHGLQQAPAMGQGTAEWLTYGTYRTLDLRPFHFDRLAQAAPTEAEFAII